MASRSNHIYINELIKNNLYIKFGKLMQLYFQLKLSVMGDSSTYENICLLRAITSSDGMTADYYNLPKKGLDSISNKIVNNVKGINRVVYDIHLNQKA